MSGARVGNGACPVAPGAGVRSRHSVSLRRADTSAASPLAGRRPTKEEGRRANAQEPPTPWEGGTGGHGRDGVRETSSAGREEARGGVTRRRATRLLPPLVAVSRPSGVAAGRDAAVAFYSHLARVVLAARGLSGAGQQSTASSVRVLAWVQTGYVAGAGSSPPCRRPPRNDRRRARSPTEGKQ
jgi:hypothetical protein